VTRWAFRLPILPIWKTGSTAKIFVNTRKNEESLKVGAVAKAAGVGVQTLHYYERLGLLQRPKRSAANYRLYSPEAIRRVRFIKKAQAIGLTLEETKQILGLKEHGRAPCRKVVELGEKHSAEIDARLAQLRAFRRALAQALADWRKEKTTTRKCAGEFCDLIERLP
jgi:DNA-binding transcriptional MerR regulator